MSLLNLQFTMPDIAYQTGYVTQHEDRGVPDGVMRPVLYMQNPGEPPPPEGYIAAPPPTEELLRLIPPPLNHDKMKDVVLTPDALLIKLAHMLASHRYAAERCTVGCQQRMVSKRTLREMRSMYTTTCVACGKLDNKEHNLLKTCARCKIVKYCSTECQRKSWATHKIICNRDHGKGILHLIGSMLANPFIMHEISVCLAYIFKLDQNIPRADRFALSQKLLFAQMDVGVEPTDVLHTAAIFQESQDRWDGVETEGWDLDALGTVEGILQVNYVHESKEQDVSSKNRLVVYSVWKTMRDKFNARGMPNVPIVMLEISNKSVLVSTCLIPIFPEVIEAAQNLPEYLIRARGDSDGKIFPLDDRLNHLNEHIRYDVKNKFLLRTPVSKRDKDIILAACKGARSGQYSGGMCYMKMIREPIYDIVRVLGEQHLYRQIGNKLAEGKRDEAYKLIQGYTEALGFPLPDIPPGMFNN